MHLQSTRLRDGRCKFLSQSFRIIRVDTGVVGGAGDGDVGEPGIDEIAVSNRYRNWPRLARQ